MSRPLAHARIGVNIHAGDDQHQRACPQARILFVSESNVCRSVLAEAIMRDLLEAAGMAEAVSVASAGSRDYNVGDGPDPLLVAVAEELQLRCAAAQGARQTSWCLQQPPACAQYSLHVSDSAADVGSPLSWWDAALTLKFLKSMQGLIGSIVHLCSDHLQLHAVSKEQRRSDSFAGRSEHTHLVVCGFLP